MIFDSPEMEFIKNKYARFPLYDTPYIFRLGTQEEYSAEREYIESLFSKVDSVNQEKWKNRLLDREPSSHIGAWFEIMLYGWLCNHFEVNVEPELDSSNPDFIVTEKDKLIIIEAKSHLLPPIERERERIHSRIFDFLHEIMKPFIISLEIRHLGIAINKKEYLSQVSDWIESDSITPLKFKDKHGNDFIVSHKEPNTLGYVCASSMSDFEPDIKAIRNGLKKKVNQHKSLHKTGTPYIVALFLESGGLSGRDVREALFGRTQVRVDSQTRKIIGTIIDSSGVLYYKDRIQNKHLSGILVFSSRLDLNLKRRIFQSCYIENPFSTVPISNDFFPVESKFIVTEKTTMYRMEWV